MACLVATAKFEMEQPDGLAVRQNWNAAVVCRHAGAKVGAGKVDFMLTERIRASAAQAPAVVGVHRRYGLAAVPGLGAFQDIARVGIDVQATGAVRQQPGQKSATI